LQKAALLVVAGERERERALVVGARREEQVMVRQRALQLGEREEALLGPDGWRRRGLAAPLHSVRLIAGSPV
jgi:hypothetical protein